MKDFFAFRTMITPSLVKVIFIIGLTVVLVMGFLGIIQGLNENDTKAIGGGVLLLLLGPIVLRFYLEIIVVMFMINDNIKGLQKTLPDQPAKPKTIVGDESSTL